MGVYTVSIRFSIRGPFKPGFKVLVKASSSLEAVAEALPTLEEVYKEKFTADQLFWAFLGSDAEYDKHKAILDSFNRLEGTIYKKQCPL